MVSSNGAAWPHQFTDKRSTHIMVSANGYLPAAAAYAAAFWNKTQARWKTKGDQGMNTYLSEARKHVTGVQSRMHATVCQ